MPVAPMSASQFHHNRKFSNRAGAHRAPRSATAKIAYDLDLGRDSRHEISRVDYVFVSAGPDTPHAALDSMRMAQACETATGKRANSRARLMGHDTIALPHILSPDARRALVRQIADDIRNSLDGVPVCAATHTPDPGRRNWHLHASFPLRHVHSIGDRGDFRLGDKVMFEQRPQVRRAAGLPATNHSELRAIRARIAGRIADALAADGHEYHVSERWRHGHLRLHEQVAAAARRGDVQFVIENAHRDASHKEGLGASRWRHAAGDGKRASAVGHNADVRQQCEMRTPGTQTIMRTLVGRVLAEAQRAGISDPEHIRMLARDHGLSISWVRKRGGRGTPVTGVQVHIPGGPVLSGRAVGASLGELSRQFGWQAPPAYVRYAAKTGLEFEAYAAQVRAAGLNIIPGQPRDLLHNALNACLQKADQLEAQAQAARAANPLQEVKMVQPQNSGASVPVEVREAATKVRRVARVVRFVPPAAPMATAVEQGAVVVESVASAVEHVSSQSQRRRPLVVGVSGISRLPGSVPLATYRSGSPTRPREQG